MVVAQYRQACAKGLDDTTALEEAAALLSSIRPAWPRPLIRALAAELVADATRRASPPLELLIDLATPVFPGDVPPIAGKTW
jgi:hypothetical protein